MTDTTALDALIEAVEAGNASIHDVAVEALGPMMWKMVRDAYEGSLDAAKALHEALVPGWRYLELLRRNDRHTCHLVEGFEADSVCAVSADPARAWLLAVLKAYRASL